MKVRTNSILYTLKIKVTKNSLRFLRQNVITRTTKRGCIQTICTHPGLILFNHMAPMAETPHTQNRNGPKVSRKVCSKCKSLLMQCHKHAVVYSRAMQKSSQSHNAVHKIYKQVNFDHSHLTTTRNNKFLIPHSKTKHHMNLFFPRSVRLEQTTDWD